MNFRFVMMRHLTLVGVLVALMSVPFGNRVSATGTAVAAEPSPNSSPEPSPDKLQGLLRSGRWVLKESRVINMRFINLERVSGSGGCNNFTGGYTLKGDLLTLGPLAATKRACLGERMTQENEFFQKLSGAHLVRLDRNELVLEHQETKKTLVFQRRP